MKFINFAVVKFSLFLVLGVLTAHYFYISFLVLKPLFLLLLFVFILWFLSRKQLMQQVYLGIATYLCFFAIGIFTYQIRLPQFEPNHYSHSITHSAPEIIQVKISQTLKPDSYNHKYFANVSAINGEYKTGKILINISKDSLTRLFKPDEILLVYSSISEISEPLNPHQFDYSKYMELQGVYGQLRLTVKEIIKTQSGSQTLFGMAQNLRSEIVDKLQESKLKTDERAIIQALVLGEKKDINKNLYEEYAAAGAVHILAVSGLHVGIIYVLLAFLFKPLQKLRYGIVLHALLVVLLLWGFAVLSGLSPSVTRAVTMFSFLALAKLYNRRTNATNTLFLSLLLLLIINPLWLFHVGFQLSYLAVFFIVWLHPIFNRIGYSKYWLVRKAWSIFSVTLCAQIGVFPLSFYYFHQFPGLFLITNIVVLPFLTLLMCGGILIVLLSILNSLPDWLSEIYNTMIESLNGFIHWIALQEDFLFKEIHFSTLKVIGAYFIIIACGVFAKKMNYQRLLIFLISICFLITFYIYDEFRTSSNQMIVFHKSGKTLIGFKNGRKLTVFKNDSTDFGDSFPIKSYKTDMNISKYSEEKLRSIFRYKEKNILVLDSSGIFPRGRNIHTIVLSQSPKVNLARLIDSLNPKQIIADGTNYQTYIRRWKKTCDLKKLPFAYTGEQGAYKMQ